MSGGISLVVAVMWSRHAVDVQHGMTAKVVRSKVDHCRHWGRRDHKWMNRRGDPSLFITRSVSCLGTGQKADLQKVGSRTPERAACCRARAATYTNPGSRVEGSEVRPCLSGGETMVGH